MRYDPLLSELTHRATKPSIVACSYVLERPRALYCCLSGKRPGHSRPRRKSSCARSARYADTRQLSVSRNSEGPRDSFFLSFFGSFATTNQQQSIVFSIPSFSRLPITFYLFISLSLSLPCSPVLLLQSLRFTSGKE